MEKIVDEFNENHVHEHLKVDTYLRSWKYRI